jgi:hypothetical protein
MTLPIPEAFNATFGLGAAREYFPVTNFRRWGNLVLFFLLLGGALLLFLWGLYDTSLAYQAHGPAMIDDHLIAPLLFAALLFVLGLLAGWSAYANWNKGLAVYEKGFAVRDRKGIQSWHNEELVSFTAAVTRHYTNGIYTGTTHVYTLLNKRNEKIVLSDVFKKVEQAAQMIENSSFQLRYAPASQAYNSGQTVVFGPVAINKAGIVIGKKTYPWAEVKLASIQQGYLKITKKDGGWFSGASAPAASIPNLRVLLSIIDQVVGLQAG